MESCPQAVVRQELVGANLDFAQHIDDPKWFVDVARSSGTIFGTVHAGIQFAAKTGWR